MKVSGCHGGRMSRFGLVNYTGAGIISKHLGYYGMKGSVCFVLKFALPPFSPPLPSGVQIAKQNKH